MKFKDDAQLGPGLGTLLLASVVIGAVYWTSYIVGAHDTYFYTFVDLMDAEISKAFGQGTPVQP